MPGPKRSFPSRTANDRPGERREETSPLCICIFDCTFIMFLCVYVCERLKVIAAQALHAFELTPTQIVADKLGKTKMRSHGYTISIYIYD